MVSRHQNVKALNKLVEEAEHSGELNLKNRKLRDISCCFNKNFIDLTISDLSYNCLNEIPSEVCNWHCLHSLNLSHNNIKLISYLDHFCFIELIDLSGNFITHLPPSICNLKTLVVLLLQNNRIVSLPTSIGKLKQCQKLDVSGNNLTNVPVDIGNMSSLKHLDVSRNSIYTLPDEIAQLDLVYLNASENKLSCIPPAFQYIFELQNVNFDNNPITIPPLSAIKKGKVHMFKLMQSHSAKSKKEQEILEPLFIRKRDKGSTIINNVPVLPLDEEVVSNHQSITRRDSSVNSFNGIAQVNQSNYSLPSSSLNEENKENCSIEKNEPLHGSSAQDDLQDTLDNDANVSENANKIIEKKSEEAVPKPLHYENVDINVNAVDSNLKSSSPSKKKSPKKQKSLIKKPVITTKVMGFPGYAPPIKEKPKKLVSHLHGDQTDQSHYLEIIKPRKAYLNRKARSDAESDISFTMRRKTEKIYEELELMEELRHSIESALKMPLPQDLLPSLTDGVVLCHLANHVKSRSIPTIYVPSPAVPKLSLAKSRRNVDNFLDACIKVGVLQSKLCTANDIMHGKGLTRIVNTVQDLLKIANRNGNRKESSFSAPSVRIAPSSQK